MANANQIKALLQSYVNGDEKRFHMIAMQIAASHARQGHSKIAKELKDLIDKAQLKNRPFPAILPKQPSTTPIIQPKGELNGLLEVKYSELGLNTMVLSDKILDKIKRIIEEYLNQEEIRAYGLNPRRRVLLYGPPGSGKTMTAHALAAELKLPLFSIQLDALITKFMGETAAKLRLVFDQMRNVRGIYFFDEFDSIGAKRSQENDVGEIRRVLNSFLQFIESDYSTSLVIAATNHPEMLDKALFRRFDDVIEYTLPTVEEAVKIVKNRLSIFDTKTIDWLKLKQYLEGYSHADLTRISDDAAKVAILKKSKKISQSDIEQAADVINDKQFFTS